MNTKFFVATLASAILLTGAASCKEERSQIGQTADKLGESAKDVGKSVEQGAKDVAEKAKEQFTALRDKAAGELQTQLDALKPTITSVKEKVKALPAAAQGAANSAVNETEDALAAATSKLDDLKNATADNWEKLANESKDLANKASNAVKGLADKFLK